MPVPVYHLTVLSEGARVVFLEPADRLRVLRRLVLYLGADVLWFGLGDTHFHAVVTSREPGRLRRDIAAILAATGEDFQPPRVKPVESQRHLEHLWPYVLANPEKHGVAGDPLAEAGSSVADLLRARVLPGFDAEAWKRHLPRRTLQEMLAQVRLRVPSDTTPEAIRARGAVALVSSAAAAVGWPDLTTDAPAVVRARAAACRLGAGVGFAASELTYALGAARGSVARILRRGATDALDGVLLRRIAFEAALAEDTRSTPRIGPTEPSPRSFR